jgi:biotin operon repressor
MTRKYSRKIADKADKGADRARVDRIKISQRKYDIFFLLTKKFMAQTSIAAELNLSRQTVNKHVKDLEILGLIKPIDPSGNPKYYKPTHITPVVSAHATPIVSALARQMERTVGKTPILVRDKKSGMIKHWKSQKKVGNKREYDTIVSVDNKRIPMLRLHSIAYTCTMLRDPSKEVPWKHVSGMKGMDQYVLKHKFKNKESSLFNMRELEVTFVRQKTKGTDELIIYMPEKYLFEYELDVGETILKEYVWVARKWFQNNFKTWLSLPIVYRDMEIAREIFDPSLKRYVEDNGMVKVKTRLGHAVIDESKIGFPEREFTTIEEVKVDLHTPERVLALEQQMKQLIETVNTMAVSQNEFFESMQEMMGIKKEQDIKRDLESMDRGMLG